ncbi:uncharacterized protein YALI1_A11643g [Yarrowia lipolytica]|uniref:Uncharacterized protein n=1 Tax=Yarrowia lipolytica TaxID=4952 RepID=A0A1D8N4G5_YARLL|nr:hypothetical protein YALI1_A11643g [Yarrowia lipolytica]
MVLYGNRTSRVHSCHNNEIQLRDGYMSSLLKERADPAEIIREFSRLGYNIAHKPWDQLRVTVCINTSDKAPLSCELSGPVHVFGIHIHWYSASRLG